MRLLLLLSAILTAFVGAGTGARAAAAQTHQSIFVAAAVPGQSSAIARARRPFEQQPRSIAAAASKPLSSGWTLVPTTPFYAKRLRI